MSGCLRTAVSVSFADSCGLEDGVIGLGYRERATATCCARLGVHKPGWKSTVTPTVSGVPTAMQKVALSSEQISRSRSVSFSIQCCSLSKMPLVRNVCLRGLLQPPVKLADRHQHLRQGGAGRALVGDPDGAQIADVHVNGTG